MPLGVINPWEGAAIRKTRKPENLPNSAVNQRGQWNAPLDSTEVKKGTPDMQLSRVFYFATLNRFNGKYLWYWFGT
jgi:hypothetical protein